MLIVFELRFDRLDFVLDCLSMTACMSCLCQAIRTRTPFNVSNVSIISLLVLAGFEVIFD